MIVIPQSGLLELLETLADLSHFSKLLQFSEVLLTYTPFPITILRMMKNYVTILLKFTTKYPYLTSAE